MNELLTGILDAHGGMDRWRAYQKVEATIVTVAAFSHSRACCRTRTRAA